MLLSLIFIFYHFLKIILAPWAGIEPATNWLTANCSTAELPRNILFSIFTKIISTNFSINIAVGTTFFNLKIIAKNIRNAKYLVSLIATNVESRKK